MSYRVAAAACWVEELSCGLGLLPRLPGGRRFWAQLQGDQMRRGGCDVPVVAVALLAFAGPLRFAAHGDQGLETLGPEDPCRRRAVQRGLE